jgi:hypothetical protein
MSRKTLDIAGIQNELVGGSAFFPAPPPAVRPAADSTAQNPISKPMQPAVETAAVQRPVSHQANNEERPEQTEAAREARHEVTTDVKRDGMTSVLHDVNKKRWRELIEETEVHNSSLRLSLKEREQIEDVVRDLKRKYRIKTSMNELARLGLLVLIHNFMQQGEQSIIVDVKTA